MSESNKKSKYYNEQKKKLYSKIGNEILDNFTRYQSMDFMAHEKSFLRKNISDMNFKSRNDYRKDETKKDIARDLYRICVLADLNDGR